MRKTINTKRGRAYRIAERPEETELLHLATGAFVLSLERLVRPRGIKIAELSLLLYEVEPGRTVDEKVRDWGAYRPKCDTDGKIVECKRGMSIDRLLRAMRGAVARYGWWDEGVLEILDRVQKVDRASLKRFGVVCNDVAILAGHCGLLPEQLVAELGNSVGLHPLLRPQKRVTRTVNDAGEHVPIE